MVTKWEQDIYDEILEAYERVHGFDMKLDPFAYHEIIKLMRILKEEYQDDKETLREVITNAIILILSLFFRKDDDDDENGNKALTKEEQDELKRILSDVFNSTASSSESAA